MAEAGLQEVETYVSRRQNTVAQYIATKPIVDLCLAVDRRPVTKLSKLWWYQEGLGLVRMRTVDQEAEQE